MEISDRMIDSALGSTERPAKRHVYGICILCDDYITTDRYDTTADGGKLHKDCTYDYIADRWNEMSLLDQMDLLEVKFG